MKIYAEIAWKGLLLSIFALGILKLFDLFFRAQSDLQFSSREILLALMLGYVVASVRIVRRHYEDEEGKE